MRILISCWILIVVSLWCRSAAAAQEKRPTLDFKRLAEVFSPAGVPEIRAKQWVAIDTGPANLKRELHGWVIADGKEIVVIDWYGVSHKLRKPQAKEQRPKLKEDKDGFVTWGETEKADHSIAWGMRNEDISAKLKKFLADGLPKEQESTNVFGSVNARFGLAHHIIDAARHAHNANILGMKKEAADLAEHTLKAQEKYSGAYSFGDKVPPLHVFVAERVASGWRNNAIYAGHGSTGRKELKESWDQIAALPYHEHRAEAKHMAMLYQQLLDEDARWIEPKAKAIAKMTPEQKVSYWMYHLRDLDIGQYSDPGTCDVLERFPFGLKRDKANAAKELEKLDMAAIPALIKHMDDLRPTRCKGHWRSYWPEGHYLLRYGDCCQQIFESITGIR
ncbi:MAG TPA: hypothetical protein VFE62_30020 [Gemmataceae bacterium]|nr:hypothetical protein [Gemmataceae bacterium]